MVYQYTAKDARGGLISGTYSDAAGLAGLRQELAKMGYRLVKATKERTPKKARPKVKPKEVVAFSYMFAGMYSAGLNVMRCLETLEEQSENQALRTIVSHVREQVETGSSLRKAFEPYERIFSRFFLGMIEAGETGGQLAKALDMSAVYLEKRLELRQKVKSAFLYPIVVCTVCFLVVGSLMLFVVPMFSKIYGRLHVPLPGPTQVLIVLSAAIRNYWFVLLGVAFGGAYLFKTLLKDPRLRSRWDVMKTRIPLFGNLNRLVVVSHYIRTFATLASVGVPLIEALDVARMVVGGQRMGEITEEIKESVRSGHPIAEAFKTHPIFPAVVVQMADSGEEAGVLAEMLGKGAEFLDKDIERIVDSLLVKLEPVLTLGMGIVIGTILLAVYLPMFDYMNHIK